MNNRDFKELGLAVIQTEAAAISALAERINNDVNNDFNHACEYMLKCETPWRGQSWRPWHDHRQGRGTGPIKLR